MRALRVLHPRYRGTPPVRPSGPGGGPERVTYSAPATGPNNPPRYRLELALALALGQRGQLWHSGRTCAPVLPCGGRAWRVKAPRLRPHADASWEGPAMVAGHSGITGPSGGWLLPHVSTGRAPGVFGHNIFPQKLGKTVHGNRGNPRNSHRLSMVLLSYTRDVSTSHLYPYTRHYAVRRGSPGASDSPWTVRCP